jgi:hypothetical protein
MQNIPDRSGAQDRLSAQWHARDADQGIGNSNGQPVAMPNRRAHQSVVFNEAGRSLRPSGVHWSLPNLAFISMPGLPVIVSWT